MATMASESPMNSAQGHSLGESERPAKMQKPVRTYPCSLCPKTFKRSEHCSRHERGHTREKPFPCQHCGRRYARKDLVRRHEQSFHPFEITRRQQSLEATVVVSPPTSNIEPPVEEPAVPGRQAQSNLNPHLQQLHDEQIAASQRSPPVTVTTEINPQIQTSPHRTEDRSANIIEELPLATSSSLSTPNSSTATENYPPLENYQVPVLDDQFLVDLLNDDPNQSKQARNSDATPIRIVEANQMNPDVQAWDPSQTNWQNPDLLAGHAFVGDSNTVPNEQPIIDRQMDSYFQDVDFFSMLPNSGTNLEGDFGLSGYLFNSGFSPPIDTDLSRVRSDMNDGNGLANVNHNLPIATGAIAEPYGQVPAANSLSPLATVVYDTPRKLSLPVIDDDTYSMIQDDVKRRMPPEQLKDFILPNAQILQRFLTSYFTCFHRHFPILHLPSLDLRTSSSHLIFSMCAIGALYRLSRKTAKDLWVCARTLVELDVTHSDLMSPRRIATDQCKLLLSLFAVFGDDATEALTKLGHWTTEYRLRRAVLSVRPSIESLSWKEWSLRETSKRILYGTFIMSSLITVSYDVTPSFSVTQDIDLEMPDEERLWEATSAQQWEELIKSRRQDPITVRDAMNHLIFAKELPTSGSNMMNWTAFATTVVMHTVNVHMWHIMQFTQSFTAFATTPQDDSDMRARLGSQVETALARCYTLLTADRAEFASDDMEGPLISNCLALLRSAYVRVFTGAGSFNRMLLLSDDPDQVASSIQSYIHGPQERNTFLTTAVSKAYGGLLTPIKAGYLLVRKTAALSWSVEHAVAAWDCALFVTKWIHAMELQQQEHPPNDEEAKNLANFRELLTEVDSEYDGKGSLAAEITRVWACFMDDTWVWGITPKMGHVLRQLSTAFAEGWKSRFPNGNEDGPISR